MLFLTESEVQRLFSLDDALNAVEEVTLLQGEGKVLNHPRQRLRVSNVFFHSMMAAVPGWNVFGGKVYTTTRGRTEFFVYLYSAEDGALLSVMQAKTLGQRRTGAASAVATKHLSRKDCSILGVIGSGFQAETQLEAICAVRPVRNVLVYSRSKEHRERFVEKMQSNVDAEVRTVASGEEAIRRADIIVSATTSKEPVVLGAWLREGQHLNATGGNLLVRRELDEEAVKRCDVLVVDSVEQAKHECGEFLPLLEKGRLHWNQVHELHEATSRNLRSKENLITLFKSHGIAAWDVASARVVYQKAREQKVGREIAVPQS
ncbi:MAG: ornithine cyclodeaminase family protein [Bacteroidota bacterium]